MGKIALQIKANLTNVDKFAPNNMHNFEWPLKVKCTGCGEENPSWHSVSLDETIELSHGQGEANFMYKCKLCSRENSLNIIPPAKGKVKQKGHKRGPEIVLPEYTSEDDGQFRSIVAFDCRGLQLSDFEGRDGWTAESGNKIFPDVDFAGDGEWCDYNDLDNVPVEISNLQHQFVAIK